MKNFKYIIFAASVAALSLLFLSSFQFFAVAQNERFPSGWPMLLEEGNYFEAYDKVSHISDDWSSYRMQALAWLYAGFGDETRAIATFRGISPDTGHAELAEILAKSSLDLCREFGVERECGSAELSQLLMLNTHTKLFFLNEAHHISRHRAFAKFLLSQLRASGFTHFAVEALSEEVADSVKSRNSVPLTTNPYLHDPQFANLLISAHELGFKLVFYEQTSDQDAACKDCNAMEGRISRERDQAANLLAQTIEKDPDARVFAYGGFGHVRRCNRPEDPDFIPRTAYFLSRELGDDMITADQTGLYWRREPTDGLEDAAQTAQPLVLPGDDCVDMKIAHYLGPETHPNPIWKGWIEGRELRKVSLSSDDGPFPIAVEAFRLDQPADTVPIDRYTLWEPGTAYLWIPEDGARIYLRERNDRLRPLE